MQEIATVSQRILIPVITNQQLNVKVERPGVDSFHCKIPLRSHVSFKEQN